MCGIAGHVGPAPVPNERVEHALELMRHRGPDHQAHRRFEVPGGRHLDLLHARLSIIDLDPRSNQPFQLGSKWMAYNGELYNYVELRERLESAGAEFRTASDTEVLLKAIADGGRGVLDECEGMWAFALYDEETGELGLCRDRFGEKPLYLYRDGGGLYFGSEVKFVTALLGRALALDERHLQRYLVNGYKAMYKGASTFFQGLEQLDAGSVMRISPSGEESVERYWSPAPAVDPAMSYEDAVAGTRERLIRSVELRLRADVPLAFCMSGGVDSISLISTARRVFGYDVHGFTIVNTDERYEEQEMVDLAVRDLAIRHTAIPVDTTDFLPKLRRLVAAHDGPLATITYYAHWLLMESIGEHGYRISISGSAADELFTGYYDHHLAYLHEVRDDRELHARSLAAWEAHVKPVVRNPFLSDPDLFVRDPGFRDHIFLDADELSANLTQPFEEPFAERDFGTGVLRTRMLNELFHEAVPAILHEDDLNAMFFSIENRSPFLDRDLFDFAYSIPERHLVRDGMAKAVLRDSMRDIAPDPILDNRRKVGFNAPILDYLDVEDAEVRAEVLADSPVFDYVRRERVEELLDADFLPNSRSKFLFNFLNAKFLLEEVV